VNFYRGWYNGRKEAIELALQSISSLALVAWITLVLPSTALRCYAQTTPPRAIDARRAAAAGIRILDGRHVRLLTDAPANAAVDELPQVFDAAIPEWAAYFDLPRTAISARWLAFLVQDRQRFAALGLLPEDNPQFVNGYARGYELWLMDQPSDYYRRHLLLHEGTHAFMQTQLGGAGAGWYMEGMAELLGTHQWQDRQLKLGVMPANRDEVPMWGRIKLIRDAVAAEKAWPIDAVLEVDNRRVLTTDQYAWTWALAKLLDAHPQFRERFGALKSYVANADFNERFRRAFAEDWPDLLAQWEAYVTELDYGYDVERTAMVHRQAEPVDTSSKRTNISAAKGWQSTGWLLRAGKSYRVTASGRFLIASDGGPWPCEPNGVTIQYHDGQPRGVLLGAFRPLDGKAGAFGNPTVVGVGATLQPDKDAVLYLRVNDSPATLADNDGDIAVKVELVPSR
jgi:hypothetical protein